MTLDEQIAWLAEQACDALLAAESWEKEAQECDDDDRAEAWESRMCRTRGRSARECAAILLTIENTLREYQRTMKPKMRNGDPVLVIFRPVGRPRRGAQAEPVRGVYIKRVRTGGDVLVDVGGEIRRVKHANVRPAA